MRASWAKYLASESTNMATLNNRVNTSVNSATRSWADTNGKFLPDCDLTNPNAQNLQASGGDNCGALNLRSARSRLRPPTTHRLPLDSVSARMTRKLRSASSTGSGPNRGGFPVHPSLVRKFRRRAEHRPAASGLRPFLRHASSQRKRVLLAKRRIADLRVHEPEPGV